MSPADEAAALYATMSVPDLVILRHAFMADLHDARGKDLESARFCQDRIDAITRELKTRHQRLLDVANAAGKASRS